MNLEYLPSLLFSIAGGKNLWEGQISGEEAEAKEGKWKGETMVSGVREKFMIGLTVLTVDVYYFFPSNFRTMTDDCWTSNWWVNTSSDLVALTTKIAKMLRQSNKIDYFWYNLWVVDAGCLGLITHINTEAMSTDAKAARGQVRNPSITWMPHVYHALNSAEEHQSLWIASGCWMSQEVANLKSWEFSSFHFLAKRQSLAWNGEADFLQIVV